jgi:hypothetical protein
MPQTSGTPAAFPSVIRRLDQGISVLSDVSPLSDMRGITIKLSAPPQLRAVYGDRPITAVVFLRFRPTENMKDHMRMMHGR